MVDLDACLTWGCHEYIEHDGKIDRARYIAADEIDAYAKEIRPDRPDRAGLLGYISGQIRAGSLPSKKSVAKARKELDIIRGRLEKNHGSD